LLRLCEANYDYRRDAILYLYNDIYYSYGCSNNRYHKLLTEHGVNKNDFFLSSVGGKEYVCNSTTWGNNLLQRIKTDIGRGDFIGVLQLSSFR